MVTLSQVGEECHFADVSHTGENIMSKVVCPLEVQETF